VNALLVAAVLVAVVTPATVAVASRWPLMGNAARLVGRLPILHNWVSAKQPIIDSAEHNLLAFYRVAPAVFCKSLTFNFRGTRWQYWRCFLYCSLWDRTSRWSAPWLSRA